MTLVLGWQLQWRSPAGPRPWSGSRSDRWVGEVLEPHSATPSPQESLQGVSKGHRGRVRQHGDLL
jgi:hypothetical protein